ncbi:MAG: GGDEF domain-containing protein [Ruminococcus sp.]|nr:GGDEF domain-containing protein [Ruminococcus sp.]
MDNKEFDLSSILKRLEDLENENKSLRSEVTELKNNNIEIKEEINTINRFISAMTESRSIDEVMTEIESAAKQLTGSDKVTFYCMDNTSGKMFSEDEGRQWQTRDTEDIKSVFETQEIKNFGNKALIPLVTSGGDTLGVLKADKRSCFDSGDLSRNFKKGGTFVENIRLGLEKEYQHQGRITDELTQMYNRQGLNEYLSDTVVKAFGEGKSVNLLMSDIDRFKNVNDTYGHDAGDEILKSVAGVLKDFTKNGADSCFRLGGEEMMTILITDTPEEAVDKAEQLRRMIESTKTPITQDGEQLFISVTASIGVHEFTPSVPVTKENVRSVYDEQFKIADNAVYRAKEAGRDQVICSDSITYMNYLAEKAAEIFATCEGLTDKAAADSIRDMIFDAFENHAEDYDLYTVIEALREYADVPGCSEDAEFYANKIEVFANGIEEELKKSGKGAAADVPRKENSSDISEEKSPAEVGQGKPETSEKHVSDVIDGIREWTEKAQDRLAEQDEQFRDFYGSDGER